MAARTVTASFGLVMLMAGLPRVSAAERPPAERGSPEVETRAALDALAGALDAGLQAVGLAPLPGLWAPVARGYHVPGVGAVFTLSPRRLPAATRSSSAHDAARAVADATAALERTLSHAEDAAVRTELRRSLDALRASRHALAAEAIPPPRVWVMIDERAVAREVRRLEEQTELLRREAERAWADADHALQQAVLAPVAPAPPVLPAAPAVPAPPAPPTDLLAPPLLLRSQGETPPQVERALQEAVGGAVADVLEKRSPALRLSPEESVVVAVDFLPRRALWAAVRPLRTVVVRVKQKDLDGRRQSRLSADELRQRMEVAAY